jgi:ATP-dependent 26S proteasome regulatory subunit
MDDVMKDYVRAGYPLLWARTYEPDRLISDLVRGPIANLRRIAVWDCNRGYRTFESESGWSAFTEIDDCDPFDMPSLVAKSTKTLWVLLNYHWFMQEPKVLQGFLNNLGIYKAKSATVLIVSPEAQVNAQVGIPKEIDRELTILDYTLPNKDDLNIILNDMVEENNVSIDERTRGSVLDSAQGLTYAEAENAMALSLVRKKAFDPKIIYTLKAQMVEKSAALEFSNYQETFANLGGLDNLKEWTLNRFSRRKDTLPFRGIMLLGVPGTGKSHFAKALANEVGWPCLTLNFGKVFGKLVGESEGKMRESLSVIDAMGRAVLFIDEIDKGLSGVGGSGSNDGGTTTRVGGTFLTWMQDRSSDVFVIGTANNISGLPTEYKRTGGRWDAIFFVDLPTLNERKAILEVYLNQFSIEPDVAEVARKILPVRLDGYTGAEIRQVCVEMGYGQDAEGAANFVIPLVKSEKLGIEALREAAKSWQKASKPETAEWGTKRKVKLDA